MVTPVVAYRYQVHTFAMSSSNIECYRLPLAHTEDDHDDASDYGAWEEIGISSVDWLLRLRREDDWLCSVKPLKGMMRTPVLGRRLQALPY